MSARTSSSQYTFFNLRASTKYTVVALAGIGNVNGSNSTRFVTTNSPVTTRPTDMSPTTDSPSECMLIKAEW